MLAVGNAASADDSLFFAEPDICVLDVIDIPQALRDAAGLPPGSQETILESDAIEAPDSNTLILSGNAQAIQGPQAIFAEQIIYNKEDYTLNAQDNVIIYSPSGDKMESATLVLEMETFIGDADAVKFQLAKRPPTKRKRRQMDSGDTRQGGFDLDGMEDAAWFSSDFEFPTMGGNVTTGEDVLAMQEDGEVLEQGEMQEQDEGAERGSGGQVTSDMRGEAERMFFEGQQRQRLERARITACREGQDSVYLTASEITLDHATGIGTGKNMIVRFFRVPIFYFPRASFPINNERKTGFLFPSIGSSDSSGTIIEVPYYINIAPTKDATVHLRRLARRGVQLMGEFRYMGEQYDGIFRAEVLPGDDVFGDDRHALGFIHNQEFGERWRTNIDVQDVSDTEYFDDFSNDVNISSSSFLPQRASVNYSGDIVRLDASVIDYQSIDSSINENSQPYARLPRLSLNARSPLNVGGPFEFGVDSEFVRFDHPGDRIEGTRLDATPYVELPLQNVYGYVTPRLSMRYTTYSLDNVNPGEEDNPDRTVPIFSIDSGIAFERDTTWNDRPHYQTLEPRVYYVYAPEENQDDIPLFDTGGGNLSNISNFFRDNRFFGADRVGDENRITLGLTSRLIDTENGRQRLEAQVAQIFFLDDRNVQASPGAEPETEKRSDLLAEVRAGLTPNWEVGSAIEYSNEEGEIDVIRIDSNYYRDHRRRFEISYWYFKDSTEQVDFDLSWPLANKWQFGLSSIYDVEEGESLASAASVTYDACCWAARVSGETRRRRSMEDENAIFFTLELKNLGRFSTYYR
jgi:LPS-assembly protein